MASSIEVFLAWLALIINTMLIFTMYLVNNVFLGPFVKAIEELNAKIGGPLAIGDYTYLFPYIFGLLLLFEIIIIVAFVVVIGRRTTYEENI